jgi:hypothetical protein
MVNDWRLFMDQDMDGVPDNLDLCPGSGPATAVYRDGCPIDLLSIIMDACPGKSEFRTRAR